MRSWRLLADTLAINEIDVGIAYADVFVVLREGDARPGPNDWEATVRTVTSSAATPCCATATGPSTCSGATASSGESTPP
jgi:hypothetical protein